VLVCSNYMYRDVNNQRETNNRLITVCIHLLCSKCEHRLEQLVLRIADLELCGMYADCDSSRTCSQIIASERALPLLVEHTLCCECKRMSWNNYAVCQPLSCWGAYLRNSVH